MSKVSLGTFDCREEDIDAVVRVMQSGYLSAGKELYEFEEKVANYHNKSFGVMVNSGQSALEVALEYAKKKLLKEKLRVLCPATTYAASLWAIVRTGCIPIFCDIGEDYNIDYKAIKDIDEIDIVLAVNLCGKTAKPPQEILDTKYIIEDACESFGNANCGYGDIVCLSFYVSHLITTGSGGMICINEESASNWMKSFISHGRVHGGDFTKFKGVWTDRFSFDKVGASYRADNLSAALGLSQFSRILEIVEQRKRNASYLIEQYNKSSVLKKNFYFPTEEYAEDCVFQFFPVLITGIIDRDHLLKTLFKKGIDSRVLLSLTNQKAFIDLYGNIQKEFRCSDLCNRKGFIIGCHQNLRSVDMEYIIKTLEDYIKGKE